MLRHFLLFSTCYNFITLPEGSHNALFTNLLAAPLSILADAVLEKKKQILLTVDAQEHKILKFITYM